MSDSVKRDDVLSEQFDLDQLLNDFGDSSINDLNFFDGSLGQLSDPLPDPLTIDEIEQLLMNDDFDQLLNNDNDDQLMLDVLRDSPLVSDVSRGEVVDGSDASHKTSSPEVENDNKDTDEGEHDDPILKKRKRQERNRDAAVKSRERKKLYVRDLEIKSRYFEGECKRLGMLLNCVMAENQALRLSLQSSKAFDASMTKQESAVLLLESLLLGSLLWFLGTMCLLILPDPPRSTKVEVPPENVDSQNRTSLAPRKTGRMIFEHGIYQPFMMGKSFKASRSKMKTSYFLLEVIA